MPKRSVNGKTKAAPRRRHALPADWPELVELGFTQMEAGVYAYLLAHPPATGYAVAKALGKPAPYVYRAIESLLRQGAVLVDDSRAQLCRAVPFEEFLDQLKRRFDLQCAQAAERIKQLAHPPEDDRVYRLATVDQVFERCRAMLAGAKEVVYLDLFPEPLSKLREEIIAATQRQVKVALQVYEPTDLPVAWKGMFPQDWLIKDWPRQWIRLAVDGTEHLTALLTKDGREVYQAMWTAGPVLAYLQARSLGSEIVLHSLRSLLQSDASLESVQAELQRWEGLFWSRLLPGAENLARLFARRPGA
jgi:HTH-type transcriptional regulator, sugar sensing transcriptional regulator